MAYTREQIEKLQLGRELDELVDFYLNHSNPVELPFANYIVPTQSSFMFDGQWLTFYGTPPFSINDRLAEHAAAKHNLLDIKYLPSGDYQVALMADNGRQRIAPVVANTKALALCRAGLIGKVSGI